MNSAATTSFQMQGGLAPVLAQGLAITLTPRQVDFVQRAAGLLPAAAQPQFMQSVANMLGYAQHPLSDRDVLDVLRLVLAQRGVSIGAVLPPPKREYARLQKEKSHASTPVL